MLEVAMTSEQPGEDFHVVLNAEQERIQAQRRNRKDDSETWTGLAISGGGIRSAAFGLGVLQALAHEKYRVLDRLDYLSTVSGGGYIGSALTWQNHAQKGQAWRFPLGMQGKGARSVSENNTLDYIRQHGDYLTPGNNLSAMSLLGTVLRTTLLTSAVYFMLLLGLVFAGIRFHVIAAPSAVAAGGAIPWERIVSVSLVGALVAMLLFAGMTVVYAFISYGVTAIRWRDYIARMLVQMALGWIVTLVIALALLASLPVAYAVLTGWGTAAAGIASAATGAAGGFFEFMRQRSARIMAAAPGGSRIAVTAFLLIYGLLLLAYVAATLVPAGLDLALAAVYFLVLGLILGFFVNTKATPSSACASTSAITSISGTRNTT
jgi:hypothetical protein